MITPRLLAFHLYFIPRSVGIIIISITTISDLRRAHLIASCALSSLAGRIAHFIGVLPELSLSLFFTYHCCTNNPILLPTARHHPKHFSSRRT